MKEVSSAHFIVIDDDYINNHICLKNIKFLYPEADVKTFTDSREGMQYLQQASELQAERTVIFLDIDMPVINGWEILDAFSDIHRDIREQFTIYILTSSIAFEDKQKAKRYHDVAGFLEKPLTLHKLESVMAVAHN